MYAVAYLLALLPGLPIGFALFGRRHAAGWIVGAGVGYVLTAFAFWAAIEAGHPTAGVFAGAWAVMCVLTSLLMLSVPAPLVELPDWDAKDTRALLAVLVLAAAIAIPPFARVGEPDAQGNRRYRAYFTADFVWHMAVVAELGKFAMPPRNMYMPHRPLHYYWGYFLLPAAASAAGPPLLSDVERDLEVNATLTALLFTASIFIVAWIAVPRPRAVAAAVAVMIVASSAEGIAEIWWFWKGGIPLDALRDVNIDAVANWWPPHGLRIDGIPRCFWWVPQHSMSYVLGLGAMAIGLAGGSGAPLLVHALAGVCLGGAIAMNPFVGALFAAAWGIGLAIDALRANDLVPRLLRCAIAIVPAGLALAWCVGNQMAGGATGALRFGLRGNAANDPLFNLCLSLGPAFAVAIAGAVAVTLDREWRRLAIPSALVVIALLAMHFVALASDDSWVGFRAGQLILISLPPFAAAGFAADGWAGRLAVAVGLAALLIGLPTTLVDVYNAQDVTNTHEGPGFPWTQIVDRQQADALDWVRRATPADATVQLDPIARQRTTWSIIPSFAQRRMAAGEPRTLIEEPEYHVRSGRVQRMYETNDAREAWDHAHALRIDYVWIDAVERAAYPAGMAKFDANPSYFEPVFRNSEVRIYRVR
jgi:hypothetical protein